MFQYSAQTIIAFIVYLVLFYFVSNMGLVSGINWIQVLIFTQSAINNIHTVQPLQYE